METKDQKRVGETLDKKGGIPYNIYNDEPTQLMCTLSVGLNEGLITLEL